MLRQLCRHVSNSEAVARKLDLMHGWFEQAGQVENAEDEEARAREARDARQFDRLTKMHEREGRAISSLMTRLRLTPQSRYDHKSTHTAVQRTAAAAKAKPWETGGE